MKNYNAKKRMLKVARPVVDVFLSAKTEEERREILRKIVGNTVSVKPKPTLLTRLTNYKFGGIEYGSFNPITGKIRICELDPHSSVYAHELGHALRSHLNNDYVIANALEGYVKRLPFEMQHYEEIKNGVVLPSEEDRLPKLNHIENLRSLNLYEKVNFKTEYTRKFNETGHSLGELAACLEAETGIPQSGLEFLKLVDQGRTPGESEITIRKNYERKQAA